LLHFILFLVILTRISPQVFQSPWNIRNQKYRVAREGGVRNTDLQSPGEADSWLSNLFVGTAGLVRMEIADANYID